MDLGLVGLGKMGGNMARRWMRDGHRVIGYARSAATLETFVREGLVGAASLEDLVARLKTPRAVWLMLPAGDPTEETVTRLGALLAPGDVLLDGGNTHYQDDMRRATALAPRGIHYLDQGTSGGIWGLKEGYCLMIGGPSEIVDRLKPAFVTLAPAPDRGWGRVGPVGTGHFVKMIHNGIEYGMMQSLAEGFALLEGKKDFGLDLLQIASIWQSGSVVRSWLLDLVARALQEQPGLEGIAPYVEDSGEGRWTVQESLDSAVPAPVIALSLMERFRSRQQGSFADRVLAAMRQQFGGHAIKRSGS
ncbi:MAG: decarboxylating 6-phosphogluconate dehydrogenase [Acidobacteria bacterium]|nr:MAG: decarboxylating 6-phosphogluconate dehydrogenase [Acidobacteriota bacterium]